MKAKAFLTAAILSATCLFSSCGDNLIPAENNFSQMLSADGGKSVFVSVNLLDGDNEATTVKLGGELSSYSDKLVSALTSAKLSENPDPYDLPDNDAMRLQIEILRNDSETERGMDLCHMELFNDGTLGVFGTEQFCGEGKSYALSAKDMNKIICAAELIADKRTSCPQPMRITDPLSSFSASGAMVAPAGRTWHSGVTDGEDSVRPQGDEQNVKAELYSSNITLDFPAGFEPDSIEIIGWDPSPSGAIIYNPKYEYENSFSSAEDFSGMFQAESNTVYMVTVTYDILKYDERGFYGSADYHFETGDLN